MHYLNKFSQLFYTMEKYPIKKQNHQKQQKSQKSIQEYKNSQKNERFLYNQNKNPKHKAQRIIQKCIKQNQDFKRWQQNKKWQTFHHSHYDWWAYPYDQPSSYGKEYQIGPQQTQIMKNDYIFMKALKQNAIMGCQAWGYDLVLGQQIKTDNKSQRWQLHAIRLYKMTRSLQIFQINNEFQNAIKFGIFLLENKYPLEYGRKNFTKYYLTKWESIKKITKQKYEKISKHEK